MFAQEELVAEIGKLQRFAYKLTKNKPDADDLVQSTCLRALEKADLFTDGTNLSGWASKIMFNLYLSSYRRKAKFEITTDPDLHINKVVVEPRQETDMELANVQKAMTRLHADHYEVLNLVCIEGMQYDEVAKKLNVPIGTVRSRLSRARAQLQVILNPPVAAIVTHKQQPSSQLVRGYMPHIPASAVPWAAHKAMH